MSGPLEGRVALVAGATRGGGRGIAVALGEAGATVYATGRSTREKRSEINRPETIEETAELVTAAGGEGIAVAVDHLDPTQVAALVERIDSEQGRLDVLVNDIWGSEHLFKFNTPAVGARPRQRPAAAPARNRHAPDHEPPCAAAPHPPYRRPPGRGHGRHGRYNADSFRVNVLRHRQGVGDPHGVGPGEGARRAGCTAVALTPGWMRSELMLEHHGVSESNWRDATERTPHFCISESPRFVGRAVAALAADPERRAGTGSRSRAASSRRSTASPTPTAPGPTAGATWSRWWSAGRDRRRRGLPLTPSRPLGCT